MKSQFVLVVVAFAFILIAPQSTGALKDDECEVCVKTVDRFSQTLDDALKKDYKKIEEAFKQFCKIQKNKEHRFCYYLGGLEESATGILNELSKPLSWSMPADKICEKLKKKDAQICDLRYDKMVVPDLDILVIRSEQKDLQITPVHKMNVTFETATLGMGCFWCAESFYGGTKGIIRTTVGYAGGTSSVPSYRNLKDHTEVLEIDYDPKVITYEELLTIFWNNHEYGLTKPIKTQYMSLILYHTPEQKAIAEKSILEEQKRHTPEVITTKIKEKGSFYPAESYHQKYRLQGHKDLCSSLNLNVNLLETSYVATKLNGYLAGIGGLEQFKDEVDTLGLTPTQIEYCNYYVEKNFGHGLYC